MPGLQNFILQFNFKLENGGESYPVWCSSAAEFRVESKEQRILNFPTASFSYSGHDDDNNWSLRFRAVLAFSPASFPAIIVVCLPCHFAVGPPL